MTQLYLIRHGIAVERSEWTQPDEQRPLTPQGKKKTRQVAQRLLDIGIKFDLVLTSPLTRAYQTTEILQKEGLSQEVITFDPLKPEGHLQDWVNWYTDSRYNEERRCLALVGHQPDLGDWAENLVWGDAHHKLVLKKAGILGLTLPSTLTPIGNSELFLLTSPKWLIK